VSLVGTILTSGAVGTVIAAVLLLIGTLRTLRANKPITESTADEKQALANQASFAAQQGVITTLEAQLKRQEDRALLMQKRLDAMEVRLEEAEHQNDQLAANVERAESDARLQKQYVKTCRDRNQMLSTWIETHFANDHPTEERPPPHLTRFQ
jgi:chromosome segregation ATPase